MKQKTIFADLATHIGLLAYVSFLAFPLVWMVSTSFKSTGELYSGAVTIIPQIPTLEQYKTAVTEGMLLRSIWNSFTVGVLKAIPNTTQEHPFRHSRLVLFEGRDAPA